MLIWSVGNDAVVAVVVANGKRLTTTTDVADGVEKYLGLGMTSLETDIRAVNLLQSMKSASDDGTLRMCGDE